MNAKDSICLKKKIKCNKNYEFKILNRFYMTSTRGMGPGLPSPRAGTVILIIFNNFLWCKYY